VTYQAIPLKCTACGEEPARFEEVGLSSTHELVIHWWCGGCRRIVAHAISLTECWHMCPAPDAQVDSEPAPEVRVEKRPDRRAERRADTQFLAALGIRY
jgi:hypothetical protein